MNREQSVPASARRRQWRPILAAATVILPIVCYVERATVLPLAAWALTVETGGPRADFIVPLGGGAHTRPFVAASLYRRNVAPTVLVFQHAENDLTRMRLVPTESELYKKILQLEGVPASAIRTVPGAVNGTWGEAQAVRRLLPANRPAAVVVVTSPEHSRRARWAFRRAFSGMPIDVRMAPARHLRFDETNWWRDDEGVSLYLQEYVKLPYYWIRYRLWPHHD